MADRSVFKYEIKHGTNAILVPSGAKILCVNSQKAGQWGLNDDERVFLWAEVGLKEDMEKRTFSLYATGQYIDSPYEEYVGTAFLADRALVFHVYEAKL